MPCFISKRHVFSMSPPFSARSDNPTLPTPRTPSTHHFASLRTATLFQSANNHQHSQASAPPSPSPRLLPRAVTTNTGLIHVIPPPLEGLPETIGGGGDSKSHARSARMLVIVPIITFPTMLPLALHAQGTPPPNHACPNYCILKTVHPQSPPHRVAHPRPQKHHCAPKSGSKPQKTPKCTPAPKNPSKP
jgi:hypothetical protein